MVAAYSMDDVAQTDNCKAYRDDERQGHLAQSGVENYGSRQKNCRYPHHQYPSTQPDRWVSREAANHDLQRSHNEET